MRTTLFYLAITCLVLISCQSDVKNDSTSDGASSTATSTSDKQKPSTEPIVVDNVATYDFSTIPDGATVSIKPDRYTLKNPIFLDDLKNVTIDGNNALWLLDDKTADVIIIRYCEGLTLKNITAKHVEPEGPEGCTGNVVLMTDGRDNTIYNCDLNGSGIIGIAAFNTTNLLVENCLLHQNSSYGIVSQASTIKIMNNTFQANGKGHIAFSETIDNWPPENMIKTNKNMKGLEMEGNIFD